MRVLVVSVHPDDETLGCGGTLLKHQAQGDDIFWLIITDVVIELGYSQAFIEKRKDEIQEVSKEYGFQATFNLSFPTTKLHIIDFSELIEAISSVVNDIKPQTIYTVNRSDIHTDHQISAKAVISSTKSFRNPFIKRILMYECISETEVVPPLPENVFIPHIYSDISDFMGKKIEIMKIYESEIQDTPLPRSIDNIRALAKFRGSTVAVEYAEAFMIIKDMF